MLKWLTLGKGGCHPGGSGSYLVRFRRFCRRRRRRRRRLLPPLVIVAMVCSRLLFAAVAPLFLHVAYSDEHEESHFFLSPRCRRRSPATSSGRRRSSSSSPRPLPLLAVGCTPVSRVVGRAWPRRRLARPPLPVQGCTLLRALWLLTRLRVLSHSAWQPRGNGRQLEVAPQLPLPAVALPPRG